MSDWEPVMLDVRMMVVLALVCAAAVHGLSTVTPSMTSAREMPAVVLPSTAAIPETIMMSPAPGSEGVDQDEDAPQMSLPVPPQMAGMPPPMGMPSAPQMAGLPQPAAEDPAAAAMPQFDGDQEIALIMAQAIACKNARITKSADAAYAATKRARGEQVENLKEKIETELGQNPMLVEILTSHCDLGMKEAADKLGIKAR
jgi:hypothetical protein